MMTTSISPAFTRAMLAPTPVPTTPDGTPIAPAQPDPHQPRPVPPHGGNTGIVPPWLQHPEPPITIQPWPLPPEWTA